MNDLDGRRALVTGASGGIGAALAEHLARAGVDVVLTYSGHREQAEQAAERVRDQGRAATLVRADLASSGAGLALVDKVTTECGPLDVVIANAGLGVQADWERVDTELWDQTLAVNITAPWQMSRAVLPGMIDRGWGRIVYVSSVAALNGGVVGPHYAASKAALHGLMHHLAPRVAGSGVTVNTVAPALIAGTRMLPGGAGDEPPLPIPVGHLGRPEDVAMMVLAMVANPYLTNKVITVDGGIYPA